MINFWSYKDEYKKLRPTLNRIFDQTLKSGQIFFGKNLQIFEKNFNKKYKSKYGIAVGSGTDALLISLLSINIQKGDEVITASNTAIPTISAIVNSGAKPVLVDIKNDYLIDPDKIEMKITKKTRAIIPVHLYGQACDMDKIIKIAKKYKLIVIEDCAQAQGAKFKNKNVGNFGNTGCFSFYPTKILGAYGDGGFITTNNKKIYMKLRRLRFYGMEQNDKQNKWNNKYFANENGTNSRMSEIQSAILNVKLNYLNKYIIRRREIAKMYDREIKNTNIIKPIENKKNFHVYHLYVVAHKYKNRDIILNIMKKNKIFLGIQYPYPLHIMTAYKDCNYYSLKNTEDLSNKVFSLPTYPEIENSKVKKIIKIINNI